MKKLLFVFLLTIAMSITACGNEDVKTPQEPQKTEGGKENENTVAEDDAQDNTVTEDDAQENTVAGDDAAENSDEQSNESDQNAVSNDSGSGNLDDYMASLKEQSDSIKTYLENEATTQQDMNEKSQELYKLWDDALNYLWGELKNKLPEDEFAKLLDEQRAWVTDKEAAVEEAGKEVEGGSMYPLVVNSEGAKLTEERVYELYEQLK